MTLQSSPKTLPGLFDATNWVLLRTQKAELLKSLEVPSLDHELLDGMVSFLDAIQDAAELQGYPAFPDETEIQTAEAQAKLAEALRLQHAFWDALSDLEWVLDIEIESTSDLAETSLNDLLHQAAQNAPVPGLSHITAARTHSTANARLVPDKSQRVEEDQR